MLPRASIILLLAATAACGSGSTPEAGGTAGAAAATRVPDEALEHAQMQAGTDWVEGTLVSFCRGGDCRGRGTHPERSVRAPQSGLVLFIVGATPAAGGVVIRRDGRTVMKRALRPATIMPLQARLPSGRYRVALSAEWGERTARWIFGLRVT